MMAAATRTELPYGPASRGVGPLIQGDLWAPVEGTPTSPEQAIELLRQRFPRLMSHPLARFSAAGALEPGSVVVARIPMEQPARMAVAEQDERRLTFGTLEGSPELGRVTLGAERDQDERLTLRMRSRTRASSLLELAKYALAGYWLQGWVWQRLIERWARACGGKTLEGVHTSARRQPEDLADRASPPPPTFGLQETDWPRTAPWRLLRGWTNAEMQAHLRALRHLPVNFTTAPEQMTHAHGWTVDGLAGPLGHEPPGPPLPDGYFARARQALIDYHFSHPAIVVGHFDPTAPMLGRDMLLEIKVGPVRFLNGVRVMDVRDEAGPDRTVFGFRYDTLEGHIEQGFEWFLIEKDHRTGAIHGSIEAHWRLGQFPTWWSRVGFALFGQLVRVTWRRLAFIRLRRLAHRPVRPTRVQPGHLLHGGKQRD